MVDHIGHKDRPVLALEFFNRFEENRFEGKVMLVNHKFENFAKCHLYNVFYAFVFVSLRNIVCMDF